MLASSVASKSEYSKVLAFPSYDYGGKNRTMQSVEILSAYNTFRTFADKETVDYSQSEKKLLKTEMVKKPWIAKQKILEAMELRLDAAIDKTENLARDVEIDHMMKKFDSLMEKAHTEQVISMVAEPDSQYGSEVFEEYERGKGNCESAPETTHSKTKNDGKSR